jgi:hypothetical protein
MFIKAYLNGVHYRMYCMVEQALKKQIITIFECTYLENLKGDMVGFARNSARETFDHLFLLY